MESPSATNSDGQTAGYETSGLGSGLKAYPNPFMPGTGNTMKFTNLPSNSTVKVYTLSGKLVNKLAESSGEAAWNGNNSDGKSISPGLYIYVVTDEEGNKKTGKLAIK